MYYLKNFKYYNDKWCNITFRRQTDLIPVLHCHLAMFPSPGQSCSLHCYNQRGFFTGRWPFKPSSAYLRCTVLFKTDISDSCTNWVNRMILFFTILQTKVSNFPVWTWCCDSFSSTVAFSLRRKGLIFVQIQFDSIYYRFRNTCNSCYLSLGMSSVLEKGLISDFFLGDKSLPLPKLEGKINLKLNN